MKSAIAAIASGDLLLLACLAFGRAALHDGHLRPSRILSERHAIVIVILETLLVTTCVVSGAFAGAASLISVGCGGYLAANPRFGQAVRLQDPEV